MAVSSKYIVFSGTNYLELDLNEGALNHLGQEVQMVGAGGTDVVFLHPGVSLDFRTTGSSGEKVYLTGALGDYQLATLADAVVLTRGAGTAFESLTVAKGTSALSDTLVFADGSVSAFTLQSAVAAPTVLPLPVPTGETSLSPNLPLSHSATVRVVLYSSSVIPLAQPGVVTEVIGNDTFALDTAYTGAASIILADFVSNSRGMSGVTAADARVNAAGFHKLQGFEVIDTSQSAAAQTLTIAAADVNQLSETNDLHVKLGNNDTLVATGFTGEVTYGYYVFDNLVYDRLWTGTSGGQTVNLYATSGDLPPVVSAATATGTSIVMAFDQAMASTSLTATDFLINGSAASTATLSGTGSSTLTLASASAISGVTTIQLGGTQLLDLQGESARFKAISIGTNGADTIDRSAQTTAQALFGSGGNDTLIGSAASDLLVGGAGDDTMTGGGGGDIFAFKLGESSNDSVTDFSKTSGDRIDLRGILAGSGFSAASPNSILQLTQVGNDAVLKIDVDGNANFVSPTQSITFTNAGVTGNLDNLATLLEQRVIIT